MYNKSFNIAKNPKFDGYQRGIASMVYKFFDNKTSGETGKNENISNKELGEEIHKPIIRKFKKKSAFNFYRKYLGCWFCWYEINISKFNM